MSRHGRIHWLTPLLLLACLPLPAACGAHPYHVSATEIAYNRESGTLEVAMQLHALDLENALRQHSGIPVDLDRTQGVDRLIVRYLEERFAIRVGKRALPISWVGKELTINDAWLYFELPVSPTAGSLHIQHSLFFEQLPDQTHTVTLRWGQQRQAVTLSRARPTRTLQLKQADSPETPESRR